MWTGLWKLANKEVKKEEEDKNICSVSLIENDLMNLHLINAIDLLSMSEGKEWQSRAFPNCILLRHFLFAFLQAQRCRHSSTPLFGGLVGMWTRFDAITLINANHWTESWCCNRWSCQWFHFNCTLSYYHLLISFQLDSCFVRSAIKETAAPSIGLDYLTTTIHIHRPQHGEESWELIAPQLHWTGRRLVVITD